MGGFQANMVGDFALIWCWLSLGHGHCGFGIVSLTHWQGSDVILFPCTLKGPNAVLCTWQVLAVNPSVVLTKLQALFSGLHLN